MTWRKYMKSMNVSNNYFSGKHGPLLIAEIGGNHGGNFNKALKLTMDAINADVDYIKYQIYTGDGLVSKSTSPERFNHFKKLELTTKEYKRLARICQKNNVGFMASIWQEDLVDVFDEYSDIFKVGSGDFTNLIIIDRIIKTNKPIILSTGLASEEEVLDILDHIKKTYKFYDKHHLAILQCTSMYPIDYKDANLRVIQRYKDITNLTVGYSDHTVGFFANIIAYSMGAEVIEFHFTDDKNNNSYRDHQISLDKNDVKLLIEGLKSVNLLKGDSKKKLLPIEIENQHHNSFRRSLYALNDIKKGEEIKIQNITALRPLVGIDARYYLDIIGMKAKRNFTKGEPIHLEDLNKIE